MTIFSDLRSSQVATQAEVPESKRRDRIRDNGTQVSAFCLVVAVLSFLMIQMPVVGEAFEARFAPTTPTATSLVSSLNPSGFSQSLTLTATVVPQGGTGTPTGTVTFLDGPNQLGQVALDVNGQAQLASSTLAVGSHSISAQYSGDVNFESSTAGLTQTINPPPTPNSITVNPANQTLILGGNTQQYTATGNYSGGSTIDLTSVVSWSSSSVGVATISSTGLASTTGSGYTSITASYGGVASAPVTLGVKTPGAFVMFLGGGSSAMFLELGQAAQSSSVTNTPCVWTYSSLLTDAGAQDDRPTLNSILPMIDYGDIWITWSPGSGTCAAPAGNFDVYAYTSLDSVLGVRCYFEVDDASGDSGCVQIISVAAGTAGSNLLCAPSPTNCTSFGPDTALPEVIISALQLQHWFAAGTDILPQDAKFSLMRMFTACGQQIQRQPFDQGLRVVYGLGYQGTIASIGLPIVSTFRDFSFNTLDFNFIGNDPINTAFPVPQYSLTTLGAKPILVAVSPAGGPGIGAATDITGVTLTLFEEGVLGRNTDLIGPTVTAPITTLLNEPFSGPYNVMEYSIPNSNQFHSSQDDFNCNGAYVYSNPMYLQSTNGQIPAVRVRVLGTAEMVSQIQAGTASDQRLGYFYWSAANASTFTSSNGKYLTVNGVDPIQNAYTDGVLPGVDSAHPLSNVTFYWLNSGDYPIWSVLRIISTVPTPVGVTNLITAAQGLNVTQHNFIDTASLAVWHSHYYLPVTGNSVAALGNTINTAGDLCPIPGALPEYGGDLGGANVLKQANIDFCLDFGNVGGLINKVN